MQPCGSQTRPRPPRPCPLCPPCCRDARRPRHCTEPSTPRPVLYLLHRVREAGHLGLEAGSPGAGREGGAAAERVSAIAEAHRQCPWLALAKPRGGRQEQPSPSPTGNRAGSRPGPAEHQGRCPARLRGLRGESGPTAWEHYRTGTRGPDTSLAGEHSPARTPAQGEHRKCPGGEASQGGVRMGRRGESGPVCHLTCGELSLRH